MKILFHYPGPFYETLDTGEKKRPKRLHDAFRDLGHEVVPIVGNYHDRLRCFRRIRRELSEFDFLYSENSTLPLAMTGGRRFPRRKSVDYQLFREAQKVGLSRGVYYRDIFWKFRGFAAQIGWLKYLLSRPFYRNELELYRAVQCTVFVPSNEVKDILPIVASEQIIELPPGGDMVEFQSAPTPPPLRFIYVGSIQLPFYDISRLLAVFKQLENQETELHIVTRKELWQEFAESYNFPRNVTIHHVEGEDLVRLLKTCHVSVQNYNTQSYRAMALPLKLFEAVTFGLPMVTLSGTATSRFVQENQFGWVVDSSSNSDVAIFRKLSANFEEVQRVAQHVRDHRHEHTWEQRARKIVAALGPASGGPDRRL